MTTTTQNLFLWIQRNERRLSTLVFFAGFLTDLATFIFLNLSLVNLLFLGYLAAAAVCTFISHRTFSALGESTNRSRWLGTLASLGAQFFIGSLLSGCLIFYTKSATLAVSWPFILLLLLVFIGNEFFRSYRAHLVFQTVLLFFALYAYTIFALPLYVGNIGSTLFLLSTLLAVGVFFLFLLTLAVLGFSRLKETLTRIVLGVTGLIVLVMGAYFTNVIPPIPLTLSEKGVYQKLARTSKGYELTGEARPPLWRELLMVPVVHHVSGTSLYVYSAVFAPGSFSTNIVHRWERYDEVKQTWVRQSMVAFPLSGGREGGYRGYSEITTARNGLWRVSIETQEGQVIGRVKFTVEEVSTEPELYKVVK